MRFAIYGYGNLGRGVENAINEDDEIQLVGIFTRRNPEQVISTYGAPVYSVNALERFANEIDVMINCGGSKSDLPHTTPKLASRFNVVDSFDTHTDVSAHFAAVDEAARRANKLALISAGWDPGLFSIARMYGAAVLRNAEICTLWGPGVSQGHSEAVRGVPGVRYAASYTVSKPDAETKFFADPRSDHSAEETHRRVVYVVADENADRKEIEKGIVTMPAYYLGYDTEVHFVEKEEFLREYTGFPHAGKVLCASDETGDRAEFRLTLPSNPAFTGRVLTVFAKAVCRLSSEGRVGAITPLEIPPSALLGREETLKYI
ncbi:MAG: diaminopimelate dehydrogenase [Clostridia bacterium]|nr:diaminopimelate dehydrogenase [Clostridia bacterium]